MALLLFFARDAIAPKARLQALAEAMAEPNTSTSAICMAKASRLQKPDCVLPWPPQAQTNSSGPC